MKTIKSDGGLYHYGARSQNFLYNKVSTELKRTQKENEELKKLVKELLKKNEKLLLEIERLTSILGNNSKNSSLPPSSDQKPGSPKSPNEYNGRKKTNRRPGGQSGRHGTTLTKREIEHKISSGAIKHKVVNYGTLKSGDNAYISKYVLDLKADVVAYEYRFHKGSVIPQEFRSDVIYGPEIKSLAVALYSEGDVSFNRICDFLNSMSSDQLNLSIGSVYNFVYDGATSIKQSLVNIADDLSSSKIMYTDSTNVTVNGIQEYIRNQSTDRSVLYVSLGKKNLTVLKQVKPLNGFTGTLVHDHETALYHFGMKHGECNAHLFRYLAKTLEETKNSWAKDMINFLSGINTYRNALIEQKANGFGEDELIRYSSRYDEIIKYGIAQNKTTERRFAKREERKLLNRLVKYKDSQLLFMYDFDVGFTNNMSERDLRKCKNKQKISGFRKQSGKQMYCDIMSFVQTCKRRNINVLYGLQRALIGDVLFMGE